MMRAAQLLAYKQPLEIREVPVPEPRGENVLIRIGGAGLCHSDLHLMGGESPIIPSFPFTLGHENAGTVAAVGENVQAVQIGDPVVVFGGWSVTSDRFTRIGQEQLGTMNTWAGIGQPGGYADYLLVPTYRYLLPAQGLDLVEAAALTDAGLSPYRAVKKLVPAVYPGSTVVIIGCGGLGQFGVQYARLLLPAATTVVAVDVDSQKLEMARNLGAEVVVNSRNKDPVQRIKELTSGEGAQGVIDFVGADATLRQTYQSAGRQARVVVVGLAGGTLPFTTQSLNEAEITTSSWGSIQELSEVLALARKGLLRTHIQRVGFDEMNQTFDKLAHGQIEGRAVLVPES
jgi:propanol-preferring alcohol dehydrogenase